jgi:O-antigen biosynthesis protein
MNSLLKLQGRKALKKIGLTLAKDLPKTTGTWAEYSKDAVNLVTWCDCSIEELDAQQQHPERLQPVIKDRVCHWYLPAFDSAFYGGIMTILRLAHQMQETDGVKQRFLICGVGSAREFSSKIALAFPNLSKAEVLILDSASAIENVPSADYAVASLWTTAYAVLKLRNVALKFYMIQDYEPLFYPAGSTYAQAELTYRFGFYGIANTQALYDIYSKEFGGTAVVLTPNVDASVFYPGPSLPETSPKRLFYYARPGTPRNNFELALAALKKVKSKLGSSVDIICAGAQWNPADFGLENTVTAIGMLPYAETGDLYRSCHVGLAMMMTPHPSYLPFEMMACATLVVANYNKSNQWFLKHKENCLIAQPTATCLAETLVDALVNYESYAQLRKSAADTIEANHSNWPRALGLVTKFIHQPQ